MNTEDDIKHCRRNGIPNEAIILNRLQNAEILDDFAAKLAQGDDVASGRMSVAEYDAVISALRYAVSYMRGAL